MSGPPLDQLGFASARAEPITGGLINQTWRVLDADGTAVAVVQRLHPVFGAEVNLDIEAVTDQLARAGIPTPRLLATPAGARWVERDGAIWRTLSHVAGTTVHRVQSLEQARSAGALIGRFHRALAGFDYRYRFTRAGVHDTAGHLSKLDRLRGAGPAEADALAGDILARAAALPPLTPTALRHCHGDLKISNVLFRADAPEVAHCLVDLDTVGLQTIAYELGDAMRSWCNPQGEDVESPSVDLAIFGAALEGHAAGAGGLLDDAEVASIAPGLVTVTLELAARFAADLYEDSYFGWDTERFDSRYQHNLVRARGQLALAENALAELDTAIELGQAAYR